MLSASRALAGSVEQAKASPDLCSSVTHTIRLLQINVALSTHTIWHLPCPTVTRLPVARLSPTTDHAGLMSALDDADQRLGHFFSGADLLVRGRGVRRIAESTMRPRCRGRRGPGL